MKNNWRFGAFALALISMTIGAHAEEASDIVKQEMLKIAGTMDVQSSPLMAQGKLTGCLLTFEAVEQDFVYLNGNFVKVSGSVGFMAAKNNIGIILKVVAAELDPALPNLGGKFLNPSRAYLVDDDLSTNYSTLVTSGQTDNGGLFSIFGLDPGAKTIINAVSTNKITIAFALENGTSDIQMSIQLDVADVDQDGNRQLSPDAKTKFMSCTQTLFNATINSK